MQSFCIQQLANNSDQTFYYNRYTLYIHNFFRIGGKPGVYTNVVAHLDWIREMIKDTSNDYEEENVSDTEVSDNDGQLSNELSKTSSESEENLKSSGTGIKCLASNGKLCKFPFKFRGKVRWFILTLKDFLNV